MSKISKIMLMQKGNYSVVIRTIGTGGEKYKKLLSAVSSQTIQPQEIIVVLPEGYTIDHSLGTERYVYSEKGMVIQRAVGINSAQTEFILVLDDDVCFDESFVEDIYAVINKTDADVVVPNYSNASDGEKKQNTLKSFVLNLKYIFIGQRFLLLPTSKYRVKYAPTGGHCINLNFDESKLYKTQSWNFQCFFMKTEKAKAVKIEDELWLDKTGYAIFDDMVFSYKAYSSGCKPIFTPLIRYTHLDGGTGHTKVTDNISRLKKKLYGNTLNRTIYWHKFLYTPANLPKKVWFFFWNVYATINTFLLYFVYCVPRPAYWKVPREIWRGARDAFKYRRK
jgi:GT2 family glycosyltransferase